MKRNFLTLEIFNFNLEDYLKDLFSAKTSLRIRFVFKRQISISTGNVVPLSKDDYHFFLNFRLSLGQREWDGMREYFEANSDMGYFMARMVNGIPVSMTDPPGMPFIPDMVQEIGINTLPDYRNIGYAKEVVSACISKIIADNKCPMWSCDANNHASERLAYSVGFKKLCDEYSIVL
ncbi:GNAT family N-acetyltransferase [Chloroflexota bacterium]